MHILIPLPEHDFDPTEVAVPWKMLRSAGIEVRFATANGQRSYPDSLMLSGKGLDPWGWIPLVNNIRCIGLLLRANHAGRTAFGELEKDADFLNPLKFDDVHVADYDGLLLPGGHAKGMRPYLENSTLQQVVVSFFEQHDNAGLHKPVAAICHGVVLAARSISNTTNRSVLYGKKTTALTWKLERSAWHLTKYLARFWDPDYYRTYLESGTEAVGYWSVQSEVTRALADPADFSDVPHNAPDYFLKTSGIVRDSISDARAAWVVRDGNYVSARWPGDAHNLSCAFIELLQTKK
jgi:putative intracellular protease/amidase